MRTRAFEIATEWVRHGAIDARGAFDVMEKEGVSVAERGGIIAEAKTLFAFGMAIYSAARYSHGSAFNPDGSTR